MGTNLVKRKKDDAARGGMPPTRRRGVAANWASRCRQQCTLQTALVRVRPLFRRLSVAKPQRASQTATSEAQGEQGAGCSVG